jgi:hypothetical protein
MSSRARIVLIVLVVSSLMGIGVWSFAQVPVQPRNNDAPIVLSGSDVGFRVDGHKRERRTDNLTGRTSSVDIAVGQLVVRINGQWVEAQLDGRGLARPATN